MVTRSDVAKLAGTSTAVVTYVVNNGPRPVAPATRERVLRAIDELGYRPNTVARALRAGRTSTIGLIVPDITNPFFAGLAREIEDRLHAIDHSLLLSNSADDVVREQQHLRVLLDRQVDAVLLISLQYPPQIDEVIAAGRRVIALHRMPDDSPADSIGIDEEEAAFDVVTHLGTAHGIHDVAMIAGPADRSVTTIREAGWHRAVETKTMRHAEFSYRGGYEAARSLLESGDRPPAIFAANDQQAIGAIRAAADLGLRVGQDVAIVGIDGTAESAYTTPSLTTVTQPLKDYAAAVIDAISAAPGEQPMRRTLPHGLVLRESCGCEPADRASSV